MENPAELPGEPPSRSGRGWLIVLSLSAVLLAVAALALWLTALPREGLPDPRFQPVDAITLAGLPLATRFDFPLGTPNGALVYNAQPFTESRHLGDDLNGIGGENTDLGDPVYSIAEGRVIYTGLPSAGWGNLVLVMHAYQENGRRRYLQACYAHLDTIAVQPGEEIRRGQIIGTVGNAGGRYLAHLHLELREFITPFIGAGYKAEASGWISPSDFIQNHRGAPEWDLRED